MRKLAVFAAGLSLVGATTACTGGSEQPGGSTSPGWGGKVPIASPNLQLISALEPFGSCDAFLDYVKAEARKRVTAYGLPGYGGDLPVFATTAEGDLAVPGATPSAGAPPTTVSRSAAPGADAETTKSGTEPIGGPSSPEFSSTNVQEEGVDEPDLLKTDGRYLYTLLDGRLTVFEMRDGTPAKIGELRLPDPAASSQDLLLAGDRLLALGQSFGVIPMEKPFARSTGGAIAPEPEIPGSVITQIDISDRSTPRVVDSLTIDGRYVNARMVNGVARIVIESEPAALSFVYPSNPGNKRSEQIALDTNRRIIDESTIGDWLPQYAKGTGSSTDRQPLLDCDRLTHPKQFSGFGTLSIVTVELGKGIDPDTAVGILANGDKVYASASNLYVSTTQFTQTAEPEGETSPGIARSGAIGSGSGSAGGATPAAEAASGEPTSTADQAEPPAGTTPGTASTSTTVSTTTSTTGQTTATSPTTAPLPRQPEHLTSIHKFDIGGTGPAVYRASGSVPGEILDDFAMSEFEDHLRVATTERGGGRNAESLVTVLRETDGELVQVGQVGGLGKGEEIKAVRFIGRIGYVVTFRQTDPLYTVDLADPTTPQVRGELKVLGYSAYLHPISETQLIGIGQDATDRGRTLGTQIALYDVADPARPREIQKVTIPGGQSEVEADYHAFLWWAKTKLALVPVQSYGYHGLPCAPGAPCPTGGSSQTFVGVIGYVIEEGGIRELGRIVNPGNYSGPNTCPPVADCAADSVPVSYTHLTLPT
ncbi:MAG: beta-propeller domain-containing protein, partial [Acidimicrobiales bacterium]|nr:beta-propeller domain-containing protein [Acidimicrobiales bacterium]